MSSKFIRSLSTFNVDVLLEMRNRVCTNKYEHEAHAGVMTSSWNIILMGNFDSNINIPFAWLDGWAAEMCYHKKARNAPLTPAQRSKF